MFCRRSFKVAKEFINFAQMSSSETVDQLRQKLAKLDADIDSGQKELVKRKKKVKDLETEVRKFEEGKDGILNRLALFVKATKDMEAVKVLPCLKRQNQLLISSRKNRRNWLKRPTPF